MVCSIELLHLAVAAFAAFGIACAEDHLAEAISHTKEAVELGKQGQSDVLVKDAEAGLKHAEAAEKAKANPHIAEGVTHLKASIAEGKKKDAAAATSHAEEALTHLEAATK
jgi:Small metal-binding protein